MASLGLGALIGLVTTVVFGLIAVLSQTSALDGPWAVFCMNILCYLALAYGYFHFVNLNLASLRIRLLREIGQAPGGLATDALGERYSAKSVIDARVRRLVEGGHLVKTAGRYYLGKNKSFLLLFEVFEFMKHVVLGRGSRLIERCVREDSRSTQRRGCQRK